MRELEDQQAEIYNAITSDFLTENPNLRASCLGPNRINSAFYKGMLDEEKEEIRKYNLRMIEENKVFIPKAHTTKIIQFILIPVGQ